MANEQRAIIALNEIVKRYPAGTASLFEGKGIAVPATGRNLAKALKNGDITTGQLYDRTLGAADSFNDLSGNSIAMTAIMDKAKADSQASKGKFANAINTLLGTAQQAANIYGQFKAPGAPSAPMAGTGADSPDNTPAVPWALIAAGVGLVVVLVVVLVMIRKK